MALLRNAGAFTASISRFAMGFLPIAIVNNLLKYGLMEMTLRFRANLTQHIYNQYMKGNPLMCGLCCMNLHSASGCTLADGLFVFHV